MTVTLSEQFEVLTRELEKAYEAYKSAQSRLKNVQPNTTEATQVAYELLAARDHHNRLSAKHSIMRHHMQEAKQS